MSGSDHASNEVVNEFFSVTPVTTSVEGLSLRVVSSSGGSQLESPQEVVGFLEVGSKGDDFVDQIFDAVNTVFAKSLFNDVVVGQGDSLSVVSSITSLVDQFADGLSGGVTQSNIG